MGIILLQEQQLLKAEEYLQKAIEINPRYVDAYSNLGRVLIQHNDEKKKNEGYRYLRKAISLEPSLAEDEEFMKLFDRDKK